MATLTRTSGAKHIERPRGSTTRSTLDSSGIEFHVHDRGVVMKALWKQLRGRSVCARAVKRRRSDRRMLTNRDQAVLYCCIGQLDSRSRSELRVTPFLETHQAHLVVIEADVVLKHDRVNMIVSWIVYNFKLYLICPSSCPCSTMATKHSQ